MCFWFQFLSHPVFEAKCVAISGFVFAVSWWLKLVIKTPAFKPFPRDEFRTLLARAIAKWKCWSSFFSHGKVPQFSWLTLPLMNKCYRFTTECSLVLIVLEGTTAWMPDLSCLFQRNLQSGVLFLYTAFRACLKKSSPDRRLFSAINENLEEVGSLLFALGWMHENGIWWSYDSLILTYNKDVTELSQRLTDFVYRQWIVIPWRGCEELYGLWINYSSQTVNRWHCNFCRLRNRRLWP